MNSVKLVKYYLYCIRFLHCASLLKEKARISSPGFGYEAWARFDELLIPLIISAPAKSRNFFVRFYG